ncbi:3257_t:CDS:2 [Funneliformis geosporum]|nr:3257_t:CDS:2 [Funneliformis geosporum]
MVDKIKTNKSPKPTIVYPREVYMFRISRKETEGTEAMKTRPGIVISVESLNKWNKRCFIVPATTKKTELAKIYPFEVRVIIEGKKGKAMIDQLKTYSLGRIIENSFLGKISEKELEEIQEKIMSACGGGKSTLARALVVELTRQKFNTLLSYPFFDEKLTKLPYDYLIIDGPAKISKESLTIAQQANLIIQPVRPSLDDLNPAIREFNGLFKEGISKHKLNFLINAVGSPAMEKATRDYLSPAGYFIFSIALEEKVSYQESQNQGLSISEVKYSRLKEQVKKLIKEILNKC